MREYCTRVHDISDSSHVNRNYKEPYKLLYREFYWKNWLVLKKSHSTVTPNLGIVDSIIVGDYLGGVRLAFPP